MACMSHDRLIMQQQYSARLEHLTRVLLPVKALDDHEAVNRQCTASSAGTGLLHDQVIVGQNMTVKSITNASQVHPNMQVAIITGSGQGVGAAAARLFAEHGAKVVVSDIDAAKAQQARQLLIGASACASAVTDTCSAQLTAWRLQVAEEIQKAGGIALAVPGDVTDPAFPQKIIGATMQEFGVLHHLVNNAGGQDCIWGSGRK